jgi:hypothetical protein
MYDHRLDESLESVPIAPLPEGFTRRIMAKIERLQVQFRLAFLDLASLLYILCRHNCRGSGVDLYLYGSFVVAMFYSLPAAYMVRA